MTRLIVRFFGGDRAGEIVQREDGSLQVHGETPQLQKLLSDLVGQVAGGPLHLVLGRGEEREDGWRRLTTRKTCMPGDPDYLRALADTLLRHRATLLDRRIRGEMEE